MFEGRKNMFKVDQKVWDVIAGEGTVAAVGQGACLYPVFVKFTAGSNSSYTSDGKRNEHYIQSLYPYPVEIVKKVTKPSINWDHVHSRYNYLAEDSCGAVFLYKEEPFIALNSWAIQGGEAIVAHMFASYVKGTCDWKDSLVKRPD
jgi:hypothetical protein